MATQCDEFMETDEAFNMITIEDKEYGGKILWKKHIVVSEIDTQWCAVGRFLTDSVVDYQIMQHKMTSLRRPDKGLY